MRHTEKQPTWLICSLTSAVNDVCVKGAYPQDFVDQLKKDGYDLSYMKEEDPSIFADGCVDYLGINAYNRYIAEPADGPETNLGVNNIR